MERLLLDAQKLSGVKYDISNLSDVYTAINVIQTEIGITGTTAQEASETISGSFSMMKSAWKNLSVGLADSNADVDTLVDNFVGAVGVVGENILPTIETTINGLGTLIEKIAPQIAEKIPDIVIGVLPKLIGAATSTIAVLLSEIVKNIPKFIEVAEQIAVQMLEAIGENIPILKPFTDALALVVENFNKILPVVLMVTTAMIAYKGAMAISNVINMAKNAMQGLKVAQMALNFAMSLNPIGLVVAAIAALTVGVIYLWNTNEEFRTALINAWENIKEVAISVWEAIANFFTVTIPEAFNTAKQSVLDFITNVIEWFKSLPENIYNMVQSAIEFFQELPYNIGYLIGVIIANILKFGIDILNWAKETIPQFVNNVITFFKELPPKIGEWFVKTWEKFVKFGKDIINFAKTEIPKFIDTTVEWFKSLPEKIWEFLLQTFTKVTQWGSDLWEWARTEIPQLIQNIADFFLELPSKVANVGKNIVDGIWNGIKNSWSGLVEGASGLIEGFKSVFTGGDGFDTHSPSKWSEQVFKNVMQGGEIGIGIGTGGLLKSAISSVNGFKNEFEDIGIKSKLMHSGSEVNTRNGNRQGIGFGDIIINVSSDVLQKTDNYLLSKNIANEIKRQINSGERGVNYAY